MEILEGLLRTHPDAGDDVTALLEVAALLGLGDRLEEAELLIAQVRDLRKMMPHQHAPPACNGLSVL